MKVVKTAAFILLLVGAILAAILYHSFGGLLPWRQSGEAERLASVLGVSAGQTVAEVGAGSGLFSVKMAQIVGESGKVYSTELAEPERAAIRSRADEAGVRNLIVVEAAPLETNLPPACCDVVFLRNVYHHIQDPAAFGKSLRNTVRPGGRLAVIDFDPGAMWFLRGRPGGASERRTGHGVSLADARAELVAAGFQVERETYEWNRPLWLIVLR
jgi:ubiquinone/menaquinone biosynthesis C-methylase UbiE